MAYSWAPSTAQVADYVTSRTIDFTVPGSDTPVGDFTSNTVPSGTQVGRLIDGACSWVLTGLTAPLLTTNTDVAGAATACAAIRAAGMVEASFPVRDADVSSTASLLLKQAAEMRNSLDTLNTETAYLLNAPTSATALIPQYSFPDPTWYGDRNL